MTIEELKERARNGARVRVDFKNRKITVNGKETKMVGEYNDDLKSLYLLYKFSYPRNGGRRRNEYFKALTPEEMTDAEMVLGGDRDETRAELEATVLMKIIDGSISKLFENENWFYCNEDGLVILRDWI